MTSRCMNDYNVVVVKSVFMLCFKIFNIRNSEFFSLTDSIWQYRLCNLIGYEEWLTRFSKFSACSCQNESISSLWNLQRHQIQPKSEVLLTPRSCRGIKMCCKGVFGKWWNGSKPGEEDCVSHPNYKMVRNSSIYWRMCFYQIQLLMLCI